MNNNQSKQLVLKSINQLFDNSFFIPSYQRGYRWTEIQVKQLLDDVWQFAKNPPVHESGKEKPFYCLQPIVVKNRGDKEWEVIDGQQRLTTLFLILKNLQNQIERDQKNFTKIFYETRIATDECISSEEFLRDVELHKDDSDKNIDFRHIYNAYQTIFKWFQDKANNSEDASPRAVIAPVLLRDTKVIWYEVEESENNNSIDIFTRLNIGKIPLTNAELIKALFLQKSNFSEEKASLIQIQIASEWDYMEKTLQDNSFWYFIYNPSSHFKYDNRIEFIFDLMKKRNKESEYYHTFNEFYADFSRNRNENTSNIDSIWLNVKHFFLTFEEWYKEYELFHYVGFLIDCGVQINAIKNESNGLSKDRFKLFLKNEIKKQINCNIEDLEYGNNNKQIKKILLLFNIQTVLETQKSDMRFPFYKYKSDNWDIEHVCSQTDKVINPKRRKDWIEDMLDFFNINEEEENSNENKVIDVEKSEIHKLLKQISESENFDENVFEVIFQKVQCYFKEDNQKENKNDISNLALLDSTTNRSYGNAFFPIKRNRIIDNDKQGIFVPIATKNLFLKYYSKTPREIMYWTNEDASDYLQSIKKTLEFFLPNLN